MADKKRKRDFPSTDTPVPAHDSAPSKKQKKGGPPSGKGQKFKGQPKKYTVAPLKKRIRDLKRKLEHTGKLPPSIRVQHERELADLERELQATEAEIHKQECTGRYHMVRFFDRKKAERFLKKIERAIKSAETSEEKARLKKLHWTAQVDLNYTLYSPLGRVYSSLYPKDVRDEEQDVEKLVERQKGDREMWEKVEQATRDGTLKVLRESLHTKDNKPLVQDTIGEKTTGDAKKDVRKKPKPKADKKPPPREESVVEKRAVDEEESDSDGSGGGFFEKA